MNAITRGLSSVYKFDVRISDDATVLEMPATAAVVMVAQQAPDFARTVQIWAVVPIGPKIPVVERRFRVHGTGHPIPGQREHVGSCLGSNGLVWHVFEDVS